jgi:hypothetical protein
MPVDRKKVVNTLRHEGLPQAFFTQKRNVNSRKELVAIIDSPLSKLTKEEKTFARREFGAQ